MAKAKTTRTKGATAADKQNIALARAVNKAAAKGAPTQTTQRGDAVPEAQPTPREARDAAQKLFDKADEAGKAELIAEASASRAVRG